MNNFGDHSSHSIKLRATASAIRQCLFFPPGEPVEIYYDHEGPWYVVEEINDLHYYGRKELEMPTVPNFKPIYQVPRSRRDPGTVIRSCYWRGDLEGDFAVPQTEINKGYVKVDRLCEWRTCGFQFGNHTCGRGRVSFKQFF